MKLLIKKIKKLTSTFTIHFRLLYDVRPATGRGWRHIREPQRPPTPEGSYSFYRAPHFLLFSLTHVAFPL